ncbi:DUF1266 domain-containing protein [Streptomyces sp. CB03238]|uniref:DUF1266 domain-containing protein n=1 Tax=Streptomyces sp. CB03238 TaxID=1907777 RepID=UPI000A1047CD|nr:DUF1266 domain-containing protein [Streptomyces sp. CB03238]ORT53781.1 hypothetical protein BKD26_37430 [Streptomyces sp. CB03238]
MNWVPPTHVERQLYEAGQRGDVHAQLRVLAAAELFIGQARHEVDAEAGIVRWRSARDPMTGAWYRPLFTRGMLPPWHPDWVFHDATLAWAADDDWSDLRLWLAVNPGSPVAVHLRTSPEDRALWRRLHAEAAEHSTDERLTALHTGPLFGPLAFGLACGAHLAVSNGVPWNEVGTVYRGYNSQRRTLRESWGITDHGGWQRETEALLDYSNSPAEPEYALRVREQLRKGIGELPPADLWRETAAGSLQDRGAPPALVAKMEELVRRIMRYEARFRADGLLPEDGWVTTASAYDYGRAVNLARWGLSARYCHPQQAEQTIVHAGALAKAAYSSWESFSAGYTLGRVLRFDDEEYGCFYESALAAHRLLTDDEGSPWRNIPWR